MKLLRLLALLALLSLGGAFAQPDSDMRVEASYAKPSAEQLRSLSAETWPATVDGLELRYHLVSLEGFSSLGYFVFAQETQTCHIYIDTWLAQYASRAEHLAVVFHEVGHCVDVTKLRFNHNMFVHEGCAYGAYYCTPAEGYAEAWRYAYTARCGLDAAAIGYEPVLNAVSYTVNSEGHNNERAGCTLPLAEGVIPPLFAEQIAYRR